jgi:hypothetical protein
MRDNSIEGTIKYIETFIMQRELSGKELLIVALAYQEGLLRGLNEIEIKKEKYNENI